MYIFLKPDGMDPVFRFEEGAITDPVSRFEEETSDQGGSTYRCTPGKAAEQFRSLSDIFYVWEIKTDRKEIPVTVTQTAYSKYEVSFPEDLIGSLEENLKDELNGGQKGLSGNRLKDVLLQIDYTGDIGSAFIDGDMIHDNFCNGGTWEIGLRTFADRLKNSPLTISIAPLREGVNANTESAMAARMESADQYIAGLKEVRACPVYEMKIS